MDVRNSYKDIGINKKEIKRIKIEDKRINNG